DVAFEVVEEDAANAAGLAAVRQVEVFVAPLLEAGVIDQRLMAAADALPDAVEVDHVLAPGVVGRQVGAAAEPLPRALGEEAEIGVDGGHQGAARVQHQGDAAGGEVAALAGDLAGELLGHLAEDVGEVDAGLLEEAAISQDARAAAAAAGPLPVVFAEARAVHLLQGPRDAILEVPEV